MKEIPTSHLAKQKKRGRKPLPADKRKPPQATLKINDAILPFVLELKSNLKNATLTPDILQSLFDVLHGKTGRLEHIEQQAQEINRLTIQYNKEHFKATQLNFIVKDLFESDKLAMRVKFK